MKRIIRDSDCFPRHSEKMAIMYQLYHDEVESQDTAYSHSGPVILEYELQEAINKKQSHRHRRPPSRTDLDIVKPWPK